MSEVMGRGRETEEERGGDLRGYKPVLIFTVEKMTAGDLGSFILYTITVSFAVGTLSNLFGDFMKSVGM